VTDDAGELHAGYRHLRRGTAAYAGVLRRGSADRPEWSCRHSHVTSPQALHCAEGELERRSEGRREVFELLWCEPCGQWWTVEQAEVRGGTGRRPVGGCPRCDAPLERAKLLVLERHPVS
jgi:hypothetical protein